MSDDHVRPIALQCDARQPPHTTAVGIIELRAAAAEILLSFGADPLPRAVHRLVLAALGKAEVAP